MAREPATFAGETLLVAGSADHDGATSATVPLHVIREREAGGAFSLRRPVIALPRLAFCVRMGEGCCGEQQNPRGDEATLVCLGREDSAEAGEAEEHAEDPQPAEYIGRCFHAGRSFLKSP